MSGEAVFTEEPGGSVLYREEGELLLRNGQTSRAYRHYRFAESDGSLLIAFADGFDSGKHFVALRFAGDLSGRMVARDTHLCGPDRYDVVYHLDFPGRFATDIRVSGPRKSYRVISRYTRLP